MPASPVKLQVLLRPEWRTPDGVANVLSILQTLGINPTVSGQAAISAEAPPDAFELLFGPQAAQRVTQVPPRGPADRDSGRSGGQLSPDLSIPPALQPFVQSITTAPPHLYMTG
jgi:hypothetical protein